MASKDSSPNPNYTLVLAGFGGSQLQVGSDLGKPLIWIVSVLYSGAPSFISVSPDLPQAWPRCSAWWLLLLFVSMMHCPPVTPLFPSLAPLDFHKPSSCQKEADGAQIQPFLRSLHCFVGQPTPIIKNHFPAKSRATMVPAHWQGFHKTEPSYWQGRQNEKHGNLISLHYADLV